MSFIDKIKYRKVIRKGILQEEKEYCRRLIENFGEAQIKYNVYLFGHIPISNGKNIETISEFYFDSLKKLKEPVGFLYMRKKEKIGLSKHFLIFKEPVNLKGITREVVIERR